MLAAAAANKPIIVDGRWQKMKLDVGMFDLQACCARRVVAHNKLLPLALSVVRAKPPDSRWLLAARPV